MAAWNLANIGSDDGLSPSDIKPLTKPMLTNHQWGLIPKLQFHKKWWRHQFTRKITLLKLVPHLPGTNEFRESPFNTLSSGKMDAISQTTFSNAFSRMKTYEFRLRFHWSLFLRVQLTNIPALVQIMAWSRPGDKPLSEPMMVNLHTHIHNMRRSASMG